MGIIIKTPKVDKKYDLLVAYFNFCCPICGRKIRKGNMFVSNENGDFCIICGLPSKNNK